jgi:hypothetical protein
MMFAPMEFGQTAPQNRPEPNVRATSEATIAYVYLRGAFAPLIQGRLWVSAERFTVRRRPRQTSLKSSG